MIRKLFFSLWLLAGLLVSSAHAQPITGSSVKIWDGVDQAEVTAAKALKTDSSAITQPVSAASLPLPAGASTAALQTSLNGFVDGLEGLVATTNSTLAIIDLDVDGLEASVDGLEALVGTTNSSLSSIDGHVDGLEALAALLNGYVDGLEVLVGTTNSTLTTIDTHVDGLEAIGTLTNTYIDGLEALVGTTNSTLSTIDTRVDGLETLQTSGNASLSSIDSKTPALGQALAASSSPVVLTAAQMSTLTPLSTVAVTQSGAWTGVGVTGTFWQATQPVSGTVAATQSGTWTVQPGNTANTTAWKVDGSAVTQPVSGTVTANLAAGTNGIGKLTANSGVDIGDVTVDNTTANPIPTTLTPITSGGLSVFHLVAANTTNATSVKASAGQLYGWYVMNQTAAPLKVALHNTAGTPTAGASVFFTLFIPAGGAANAFTDIGIPFSSGIAITTTAGSLDSDATAVTSAALHINLFYK